MESKRKRNTETSKSSTNSTKLVPECGLLRKTFQGQIIDNASDFMSEKEDAKGKLLISQNLNGKNRFLVTITNSNKF
jgi:hypothetical protein